MKLLSVNDFLENNISEFEEDKIIFNNRQVTFFKNLRTQALAEMTSLDTNIDSDKFRLTYVTKQFEVAFINNLLDLSSTNLRNLTTKEDTVNEN